MTPKIIKKNALQKTIKKWLKSYDVIAPVASKEGVQFKRVTDPKEILLDSVQNTIYPPKSVFLPQSEVLFNYENGSYTMPEDAPRQRIIFGMRPCDARSVWLLDTIFNKAEDFDCIGERKGKKRSSFQSDARPFVKPVSAIQSGADPLGKRARIS